MIRRLPPPPPRPPTERTPGRGEGLRLFAEALARHVFPDRLEDMTVLDVGGADGWLRDYLGHAWYWNVDVLSPDRYTGQPSVLGDARWLPFADASVDLVISKQTLPHLDDPSAACREMIRVARRYVVIRQDWGFRAPDGGYLPIGWPDHSRVQIDGPEDILSALRHPDWVVTYDETDFVARRAEEEADGG